MNKKIILIFLIWTLILYLAIYFSHRFIPQANLNKYIDIGTGLKGSYPYLVWVWGNFDGAHYLSIARSGYFTYEHAFFPLYPLLIRLIRKSFNMQYLISAQLINTLVFVITLFLIQKLMRLDGKQKLFDLFLIVLFTFPTSFFYKAVYNDSLFFFLATLTIFFSRKRKFVLASIAGFFATLTRLNGLALIFLILFEYLSTNKKELLNIKNVIKHKIYSIILLPVAFIGYLIYTQIYFKDWTIVFSSMSVWGQDRFIIPIQVFWRYFKIIFLYPTFKLNYWIAILELLLVLLYIFLIVWSYKKIRFSYWIFIVISILIPSFTGTFQGMPRYGLHLYPFFLSLALFLDRRSSIFKICYFIGSFILFIILVTLFSQGYFVA